AVSAVAAVAAVAVGAVGAVGGPLAAPPAGPLLCAAAGALPVPAVFAGTALAVPRAPEVRHPLVVVKGKLAHAR
ncbi:hypothetical protein, partial [Streptomyces sp. NPDC059649]|uniref:hypothetical protein n=1 Tax=Streptomyces sp. NPDC059649 TaxID=3346895 RepID=UPI0036B6B374